MQSRRTFLKTTAGYALSAGPPVAFSVAATAGAPIIGSQAPGYYRLRLGDYEITALSDGTFLMPMTELYKGIEERETEAYLASYFQPSPTPTSVNTYLVNTGERLVLIDAGAGDLMGPTLGKLAANIEAAGYRADQIDDVILTHIHPDHSGGLVRNGTRAFPNAAVHVNEREYQFWLNADAATKADPALSQMIAQAERCVRPYVEAKKFETFADNRAPIPGFGSILRAGHTPGHSSIVVESNGRKMVVWGDIVHGDLLQFDRPEITFAGDVDQRQAAATRAIAFAVAADQKYLVAGAHNAFPGIGQVRSDESNYDWVPLLYSADF